MTSAAGGRLWRLDGSGLGGLTEVASKIEAVSQAGGGRFWREERGDFGGRTRDDFRDSGKAISKVTRGAGTVEALVLASEALLRQRGVFGG